MQSVSDKDVVGVVGAGSMGRGIAQVIAAAGTPVTVFDVSPAILEAGREAIAKDLAAQVKRNRLSESEAQAILHRIGWSSDYADLAGAGLVIEAIIEDSDIKKTLFRTIEAVVDPETILATNTSSLSVTALGRELAHPRRFAGLHFFNPATAMKLVEVVAGAATAPEVIERLLSLARQWKKNPVRVRDVPGFIVNRVARPYYAEGFVALGEAVAEAQAIDHVLKVNGGFKMGPLELADLIGHDVNFAVAQSVYTAYFGKTRFAPQLVQGDLVAAGRLGRKTSRGFYDYSQQLPEVAYLGGEPGGDSASVHVQQTDGRSATRLAAELNKPVALFDWSRDPSASSLAVSVSEQGRDAALSAALRHAAKLGKQAVLLSDRPGMLAFRTVCQLANAAADAVRDRVASAEGVDQAMVFGANHPEGPLATARRIGLDAVVAGLTRIAEETGDPIYHPSEILRRAAWSAA
jgi:3-hydroxybutyryl-CoA dehydrogenase